MHIKSFVAGVCCIFSISYMCTENISAQVKTSMGVADTHTESEEYTDIVPEKKFWDYGHDESGQCGAQITWELVGDTLYLTGTGEMNDYPEEAPWNWATYQLNKAVVSEGITYLGENMFLQCENLKEIQLPSTLKGIGKGAFAGTAIQEVVFPETLEYIGESAFAYCTSLHKVKLPTNLKKIENRAFYGCESLKSVKLPSGIQDIGENTFSGGTKAKNLPDDLSQMENGALCKAARVKINVKESYTDAFEILKSVNKERKKEGLQSLKMDKELLDAAMFRAAELCLYFDHTRPSGYDCYSRTELMHGENIAVGYRSSSAVMTGWMNSPGHKSNILNDRWKSVGIGCVELNGVKYWVQCFGDELSAKAKPKSYKNKSKNRTIIVAPKYLSKASKISVQSSQVGVGSTIDVQVSWNNQFVTIPISAENMQYKSSKKSVCKVEKGKIKGVKSGTAKVKIWFPGYEKGAVTKKITVR